MEYIKNLLINYWPEILAGLVFLFSVILQACKKKPINSIITDIFYITDKFINEVEVPGNGANKKAEVIRLVCEYLNKLYPELKIDAGTLKLIDVVIEKYLSTPKATKGGNANG